MEDTMLGQKLEFEFDLRQEIDKIKLPFVWKLTWG